MNRTIKSVVAALAFTASVAAFAQEEEVDSGVVGWTPVCIGLATPVQMPWGIDKWDVFGLDINVFYSDAPKMYGIDIGGLAAVTRQDMMGLQVSGLFNWGWTDVYGMRVTLGLNYNKGKVYGCEVGLAGFRDELIGLDISGLGAFQQEMVGCQICGLASVCQRLSYGAAISGLANFAPEAKGLQLAGLFNGTEKLSGCQIGLVNYTEECPSGFQIGLINIILENRIPVLPIVNGSF